MSLEHATTPEKTAALRGERVALAGPLAGMNKREAARLIREQGGVFIDPPDASCTLLVLSEEAVPVAAGETQVGLWDDSVRAALEAGTLHCLRETELWQRLGLVDVEQQIHRLYTPAMLAELLGIPVSVIRRWHQRGLIIPAREVHRLPYFDFCEVATARRLAELMAAGCSPQAIERQLAELRRYLPTVERPLAQLSVLIEGKQLLLRQGAGLIEPGGQLRLDFDAGDPRLRIAGEEDDPAEDTESSAKTDFAQHSAAESPDSMRAMAAELEDEDRLTEAAEMYRAALALGGPHAETNFRLAELLYRLGDATASRERYYMALELDEDYVEARANLGCVLAELGERELAVAAFRGTLACHGEYPDVHYHLARTLDELDQQDAATEHWQAFLRLAGDSPWADEARSRLGPANRGQ